MNGAAASPQPKPKTDFLGLVPMSDASVFTFPSISSSSQHSKDTSAVPVSVSVPAPSPMKRPETKGEHPLWQEAEVPVQAPMSNFLDADSVNSIKNAFASFIDLQNDKKAQIIVLNRKTFYTLILQHAAVPVSIRDLNDRLSGLQLCISGVEYTAMDGTPKLSVDFAKKDRFNALAQLEGSAKRARSSPLFGTDELAAVNGGAANKRTKVTKAGSYVVSAATGYSPRRADHATEPLLLIKQSAVNEADVKTLFERGANAQPVQEHDSITDYDAAILKTVVEYGATCCGLETPANFGWAWAPARNQLSFFGYERLNLDQLRGFHDLFPHHVECVSLDLENGVVAVQCRPYLSPCIKAWSATLFYTKSA